MNKNRDFLSDRPVLRARVNAAPDLYTVELARSGAPVAVRKSDGARLVSRYDPEKEIRRWRAVQNLRADDLPVVLGFHPALLEVFPERPLIIVEQDPSLLKALLPSVSAEVSLDNLSLILDDDGMALQAAVRNRFEMFRHTCVRVMALPQVTDESWKKRMATAALDIQKETSMNLLAYAYQLPIWLESSLLNLSAIMNAPDPHCWVGSLAEETAVIVAAGPSLDRNIDELRDLKGRALIIAVDTALRALDARGIIPDIVVAVDANKANALDFDGLSAAMLSEPVLVADAVVASKVVNLFRGTTTFMRSINYVMNEEDQPVRTPTPLDRFLMEMAGREDLSEWQSGGSVSTNAFSLARILGIRTFILVGHDLAFTDGRTHVKGVGYEDATIGTNDRFGNREMYFRRRLEEGDVVVPSWNGGSVFTSSVMREFIRWYVLSIRHGFARGCVVVDATEGGARIEGTIPMTLHAAARRYAVRRIELGSWLSALTSAPRIGRPGWEERLETFTRRLDRALENPESIEDDLELARWLVLPVYLGGRDLEPGRFDAYLRASLVNAVEFIRRNCRDALSRSVSANGGPPGNG